MLPDLASFKGRVFVAVLVCFFAVLPFCLARPSIWLLELNPIGGNQSEEWSGVGYGWLSIMKGVNKYRFRLYGLCKIAENYTRITFRTPRTNVTNSSSTYGNYYDDVYYVNSNDYVFGRDLRFNQTIFNYLQTGQLQVLVETSTFPTGALLGSFFNREHTWISLLGGASVVPSTSAVGIGLGIVYLNQATPVSNDLITNNENYLSSLSLSARVIHSVNLQKNVAIFGPAPAEISNGPQLIHLNPDDFVGSFQGFTPVTQELLDYLNLELTYFSVLTEAFPYGEIRGQIYPATTKHTKSVPIILNPTNGTILGTLESLYMAQMQNRNRLPRSTYSILYPDNTGVHSSSFSFKLGVDQKNVYGVRGAILEFNFLSQRTTTWNLDIYKMNSNGTAINAFVTFATYTGTGEWTRLEYHIGTEILDSITEVGIITIRISSSSAADTLLIDQFTAQPILMRKATNKLQFKLPTKFYQRQVIPS